MPRAPVTHVFTRYRQLGGVESILRRLAQADAQAAPERLTLSLFEREPFAEVNVAGLGLTGLTSPRQAARRLGQWVQGRPRRGIWVYHNGWGLPFLTAADDAERRVAFLHSDWPGFEAWLAGQRGHLDGVVAVSDALLKFAESALGLPAERRCWLPVPIHPPAIPVTLEPRASGQPLVLGYSGRVVRPQKRLDRLPELARRLAALGVPARWEILGEGPHLPTLRTEMPAGTVFHGRQSGPAYWKALDGWDLMVFTSDYEGLPISLVEQYARGGLAVFPRIGCGADRYVEQTAAELLYPAGDLDQAARAIQWYAGLSQTERLSRRKRAVELAEPHAGTAFENRLNAFLETIDHLPRLSGPGLTAEQFPWAWHLPFGILRRLPKRFRAVRELF